MKNKCYLCGQEESLEFIADITSKPQGETYFDVGEKYFRQIYYCKNCGVYNNFHDYDFDNLYETDYNASTYQNKIKETFDRIMNLPEDKSDNKARVKRIADFLTSRGAELFGLKCLDVGSGLGVFLAEMKKHDISGYALDPSPISCEHTEKNTGVVKAYCGKFNSLDVDMRFDLISFNKVLEHVKAPIEQLKKAKSFLADGGVIYVELPDGDNAKENGGVIDREEFYMEHYTVFNDRSLTYLSNSCGLRVLQMVKIHEASDKYTIYAFLST